MGPVVHLLLLKFSMYWSNLVTLDSGVEAAKAERTNERTADRHPTKVLDLARHFSVQFPSTSFLMHETAQLRQPL